MKMAEDAILVYPSGRLVWRGKKYRCALGRGGVSARKTEGDGATPAGCFPLRKVYWRQDRIPEPPQTALPLQALSPSDGWCDDPSDPAYNRLVKLPYPASHEILWREDHLYDILVTIGYNDRPPISGRGSAVFLHVARPAQKLLAVFERGSPKGRPAFSPTAGCVALALPDLLRVLESVGRRTRICIRERDEHPVAG